MSTVQTKVGHFVWHENQAADVEAAKSFYSQLCGWTFEVFKPGEMDYVMISSGGATHGGFWPAPPEGAPSAWIGHVYVEDCDAAAEKAKSLGGTVLNGPMDIPDVGRFALLQDPQGGVISAYTFAGGDATVGEGVFVWDELSSPDVDASKRFYSEVFGWTSEDTDMGGGMVYTTFRRGEDQVAGLFKQDAEMTGPAEWHPYIGTDDVDASAAKAVELGATQLVPPSDIPEMGRFAMLLDPNRAMFGLFQALGG
jgi:predicted enzyme related to lactoylglutathione lyase